MGIKSTIEGITGIGVMVFLIAVIVPAVKDALGT